VIKPEDVQLLLEEASADVAEPDLADRVWADATVISRRRRRATAATGVAAVLGLVVAGVIAGPRVNRSNEQVAPSPQPLPSATISVPSAGTIDGTPYWLGPEPGGEPYLNRVASVLGDALAVPDGTLDDLRLRPVRQIAAVLLRKVPGAERYRPVVRSLSGRWAESAIELVPTKDAAGNSGVPLDTTAVSPTGSLVAFAQPGKVIVLDTANSRVDEIPVPSATIEDVAWMPTGDRLVVAGAGAAFRVVAGTTATGEQRVVRIGAAADPSALTAPLALDRESGGETLVAYDLDGRGRIAQRPVLPVTQWSGATFSSGALAARAFVPQLVPQLDRGAQGVAVVEAREGATAKLMMMPDGLKEVRTGGNGVLGWYDDHTVLFESRTADDAWILAWNVLSGQLLRVTELKVDAVAIGPTLFR
jgi:hypothetical protein